MTARVDVAATGRLVGITLETSDRFGRGLTWPQRLDVALGFPDGVTHLATDVTGTTVVVPGARGLPRPLYVLPAGRGLGYGLFVLDEASASYLLAHVEDVPDPLTRGVAWITLWDNLLERRKIHLKPDSKYVKILDADFGRSIENNILSYTKNRLTAIVVNFVDMLAHGRSDSDLLKEIAPDESAYRSLTAAWFKHSSLFAMLKTLSRQKNVTIVLTTDHGAIRSLRGVKVIGDRDASTNLRYKYGRNLKCDERHAILVKNPKEFRLPKRSSTVNYLIAKEDYYFVYPTDYHKYVNQYRDSFQHGGISMEEMILPVVKLEPK